MRNDEMLIGGLPIEVIRKKNLKKPLCQSQSAGRKCDCKHTDGAIERGYKTLCP